MLNNRPSQSFYAAVACARMLSESVRLLSGRPEFKCVRLCRKELKAKLSAQTMSKPSTPSLCREIVVIHGLQSLSCFFVCLHPSTYPWQRLAPTCPSSPVGLTVRLGLFRGLLRLDPRFRSYHSLVHSLHVFHRRVRPRPIVANRVFPTLQLVPF
jgi:hypothetical protein